MKGLFILAVAMSLVAVGSIAAQQQSTSPFDKPAVKAAVDTDQNGTVTEGQKAMLEAINHRPVHPIDDPGRNTGSGGGYEYADSDEPGVDYDWLSIIQTGSMIPGLTDNGMYGPFDFGFDFPFMDGSFSGIHISTNGALNFGGEYISANNSALPYAGVADGIFPYWTNLIPGNSGEIWYGSTTWDGADAFCVQWQNLGGTYMGDDWSVFEAILIEDGRIVFQYYGFGANFNLIDTQTTGIQSADDDFCQYSFNGSLPIAPNTAIVFSPESIIPVTFSLTGTQTTIPPNGGQLVYDVSLVSTLAITVPGLTYWTLATLPNGQDFGPLIQFMFTHTPNMNVTVFNLTQTVPAVAPAGDYLFTGNAGFFPNALVNDSFEFQKIGAGASAISFDPAQWPAGGQDRFLAGVGTLASAGGEQTAEAPSLPAAFALESVYPNPFNASTTVSITLPDATELTVSVFDIMGRKVAELAHGRYQAGRHWFEFDGSNLSSGVYFVRATAPGELNAIRKITLMK